MVTKILLYGYEYPPLGGGVGNALKHLLEQFSHDSELEIHFVTSALDNQYSESKLYDNVFCYRVPVGIRNEANLHKQKPSDMVKFMWQTFKVTLRLIKKHKFKYSHAFGFPGGQVNLLFRWRMPYFASLRGVDVPGYNDRFKKWYIIYKPMSWIVWKFAKKVISNSQGLADLAHQTAPGLKIDIIPNGVEYKAIKIFADKDKFPQFTVTAGGTLMGRLKGLNYLIDGFAKLNKDFPDTRLMLIGSGDEEQSLREQVKKLGITDAVEFTGRKENTWIKQNLGKCHVFCLPSLNEGMSNATLEGLAAGLPLVLTETGGTAEILANNNGVIVPPKDSKAIYAALRSLYQNTDERIAMGKRSRDHAERMSWENVGEHYKQVYLQ